MVPHGGQALEHPPAAGSRSGQRTSPWCWQIVESVACRLPRRWKRDKSKTPSRMSRKTPIRCIRPTQLGQKSPRHSMDDVSYANAGLKCTQDQVLARCHCHLLAEASQAASHTHPGRSDVELNDAREVRRGTTCASSDDETSSYEFPRTGAIRRLVHCDPRLYLRSTWLSLRARVGSVGATGQVDRDPYRPPLRAR